MVRDTCLDPDVDQNLTTTKTNEGARCFGAQSGREADHQSGRQRSWMA